MPRASLGIYDGMTQTILMLNGPNLNLLGVREPDTYGRETLADIEARLRAALPANYALEAQQSNHEGQLIDWVHDARDQAAGIIINPGAYSHSSIAILDALNVFDGPVLEVHISNIHRRESFRHHSFVSGRADGVVAGFGTFGYVAALHRMIEILSS